MSNINTLMDNLDIIPAIIPVDLQTADNNGDWINVEAFNKIVAVFFAAVGTAGDDPVFTLEQATTAAGGGAKALNFTDILKKQGAALTAVAQWTRVTQSAAGTYEDETSAELQKMYAVEIDPQYLDSVNGFKFVRLVIPDVGSNAQLGCAFYLGLKRHAVRSEKNVSPLA